jgi:hypothetical protein
MWIPGILNENVGGWEKAKSGKGKLPLCFSKQHDVRTCGGAEV